MSTSDKAYGQNIALAVALISIILLIIGIVDFGADNFGDLVRLGLDALILILAIWWLSTRESLRWIGWIISILAGVAVIYNLASIGIQNAGKIAIVILLLLVLILAAKYALTHRSPDL